LALGDSRTRFHRADILVRALAAEDRDGSPYLVTLNYRAPYDFPDWRHRLKTGLAKDRPTCEVFGPPVPDNYYQVVARTLNQWAEVSMSWVSGPEVVGDTGQSLLPSGSISILMALAEVRLILTQEVTMGRDPLGHCQFMRSRLDGLVKAKLRVWGELTGVAVLPEF
jgi:hypothetical protein